MERAAGTRARQLSIVVLIGLAVAAGSPSGVNASTLSDGRSYLLRSQGLDGGFGTSAGAPSSPEMTGWAVLGLEAAGVNPLDVVRDGQSAVDYLRAHESELDSVGDLERTILCLAGAGLNPRSFAGRNLVEELRRAQAGNGSFAGQVNATAFGILALRASGANAGAVRESATWLRAAQSSDGSWGIAPGSGGESDSTGAALQALVAARMKGRAVREGRTALERAQAANGGWPLRFGDETNSQSTAWAVQGLLAVGANPKGGLSYIRGLQRADGHYSYSASREGSPVWVTGQALQALARKPLPLAPVKRTTGLRSKEPAAALGSNTRQRRGDLTDPERSRDRSSVARQSRGDPLSPKSVRSTLVADAPTSRSEPRYDDSAGAASVVASAFATFVAILAGGFLIYRRRLP